MLHWYICMRYLTCWLWDWLSWLRILIFLCFIAMFVEYIDMLIILIDHLALLSVVILILPWLFCSPHMHGFTGVYHLTWYVDSLACILPWSSFEHDVYITIRLDRHSLCGLEWYTCTLLDCMVHDYPSFVWLHVVCPCGPHFYPLTSNSLGLGHFLHFGSHFCKCEAFCVLVFWPSQRLGVGSSDGLYRCLGAFWRRAAHWCWLESELWRLV